MLGLAAVVVLVGSHLSTAIRNKNSLSFFGRGGRRKPANKKIKTDRPKLDKQTEGLQLVGVHMTAGCTC
jgi:hypothetical protein